MFTASEVLRLVMHSCGKGMNAFILGSFDGVKYYEIPLLMLITLFSLITWIAFIAFIFFFAYEYLKNFWSKKL